MLRVFTNVLTANGYVPYLTTFFKHFWLLVLMGNVKELPSKHE
jgi:hypothetical protein